MLVLTREEASSKYRELLLEFPFCPKSWPARGRLSGFPGAREASLSFPIRPHFG